MSYVDLQFDQPRRLLIDLKASKALDRVCGEIGLLKVNELLQTYNIQTLERVLWAGLQHEEPTLTPSLVAKRVERYQETNGSLYPLFRSALQAMNDSGLFNTDEPDGDEGNVKATAAAH